MYERPNFRLAGATGPLLRTGTREPGNYPHTNAKKTSTCDKRRGVLWLLEVSILVTPADILLKKKWSRELHPETRSLASLRFIVDIWHLSQSPHKSNFHGMVLGQSLTPSQTLNPRNTIVYTFNSSVTTFSIPMT